MKLFALIFVSRFLDNFNSFNRESPLNVSDLITLSLFSVKNNSFNFERLSKIGASISSITLSFSIKYSYSVNSFKAFESILFIFCCIICCDMTIMSLWSSSKNLLIIKSLFIDHIVNLNLYTIALKVYYLKVILYDFYFLYIFLCHLTSYSIIV